MDSKHIPAIQKRILLVGGTPVILDSDLAQLYGVETKVLNQAVARNQDRFPEDFSFILSPEDWENLRCQFGTSSFSILPLLQSLPDPPKREIGSRVEEGRMADYRTLRQARKKKA